jgi:phosphatidylserine decarboxylase
MKILLTILFISVYSTLLYIYLHKKTHIRLNYLYKDNIINVLLCLICLYFIITKLSLNVFTLIIVMFGLVPLMLIFISALRFYRIPLRRVKAANDEIVSPADGNVIYIKKIDNGEIPISIKNGKIASLTEFVNTGILDTPCWLIGINMTPFDVHRNCSPIDGKIILNKHYYGNFLSLKKVEALIQNERNTIVISSKKGKIGVVQTASRLVRRIVSFKNEGELLRQGDWFGMIKFGSQVDIILPISCEINIKLKQQVYAKNTIIAKWLN